MNRRNAVLGLGGVVAAATARAPAAAADDGSDRRMPNRGKPVSLPLGRALHIAFVVGPETVLIRCRGPVGSVHRRDEAHPHLHGRAESPRCVARRHQDRPGLHLRGRAATRRLVVPATKQLPESVAWIKHASVRAGMTMSVCTGAFLLAKAGLLDGLEATTHHAAYDVLAKWYPKVNVVRGARYVEDRDISTSGGERWHRVCAARGRTLFRPRRSRYVRGHYGVRANAQPVPPDGRRPLWRLRRVQRRVRARSSSRRPLRVRATPIVRRD